MDLNTSFGPNNLSNLISQDLDESFTQHGSNNLNNLNPQNAQPQGADIEENHVTLSDLERQFRQYAKDGKLSTLKERVAAYNQGQISLDDAFIDDPYEKEAKVDNNKVRDAFIKVLSKMFGGLDKIPESVVGQMKLEDYGGLKNGANGIVKKTDEMPTSTLGKKLSKDRVATVLKNAYANVNETTTKQMFNKIKLDLGSGASRNTLVTDIKGILQSLADNERIDSGKIASNGETLNKIAKELIESYQAPVNLLNEDGEEEIFADRRGIQAQNNEAQGFDKSKILDGAKFRNALRQLDELISSLKNEGTVPLKTSISLLAKKEGIASSYIDSGKLLSMEYSRAAEKGLGALTKLLQREYNAVSSREKVLDDPLSQGMAVIENKNANNKLAAIANALITGDPETKTKAINTLVSLFNIGFNNLSVSKETNNLRDRFDSFIRNAFPDYIEEGTGKITSVQLEMLKKIAPAAISGKGDLAGGAGYIGLIKENGNNNVVKFLTHYGERKSDIAENLTNEEINKVSDAQIELANFLVTVARDCGKGDEVFDILTNGTKIIHDKRGEVTRSLRLLERTAVAKALAILAPLVRDSATGLRLHFDATMEKMPTIEDTTIKSVFYKDAMPKDVMDTIKRIASYAVSKSGSEKGGNGYMLKTTYGTYMKMLTHSGERAVLDNPDLQLDANDKVSISNASNELRDDILGLVEKLNISDDRKSDLKAKLKTTLTIERKSCGIEVLSRENVAKAITEFIKTALTEKEASAFLKKIEHAGTFENTSIKNIVDVKKYLENGGIDLIRKTHKKNGGSVRNAQIATIKYLLKKVRDVKNKDKLYADQLRQTMFKVLTHKDIPEEWKNKKIGDTSTKWEESKFSMMKGGTTDVINNLDGVTTGVNCADATHAFGYVTEEYNSQEEQYAQDTDPNTLLRLIEDGKVEVKVGVEQIKDDTGKVVDNTITYSYVFKGDYGTRLSTSDGAIYQDLELTGKGNRKLLGAPKKYNMLACAGMSFNFIGGSRDKFGVLDNILRCWQHTIKDEEVVKMLSEENINSPETQKKINNLLKFILTIRNFAQNTINPEITDKNYKARKLNALPDALKPYAESLHWMFGSERTCKSRLPAIMMAFSGKNEHFDIFGDDSVKEVSKFLSFINHEEETQESEEVIKLYNKAHENYEKHLRFTNKQWIDMAKMVNTDNLVIAAVGTEAFNQKLVVNAEAWAEMCVLHAENMKVIFPEYTEGGTTGKIFRIAFEKYCYKYNIHIPETEPRITHSFKQAEALLKMFSWFEDQKNKHPHPDKKLDSDLFGKWNTEWAKKVNSGELNVDNIEQAVEDWYMKSKMEVWAKGSDSRLSIMQRMQNTWDTEYKSLKIASYSKIKKFQDFLEYQLEVDKFTNWLNKKVNFQEVCNALNITTEGLNDKWQKWVDNCVSNKKSVNFVNFLNSNEIKDISLRWYEKRIENWVNSQNLQPNEAQDLLNKVKEQWKNWDNYSDWKKANVMDDLRLEDELNAWKMRTDYVNVNIQDADERKFMQSMVDGEWRNWQSEGNLNVGAKFEEFRTKIIDPMRKQMQWVTQNENDSAKRNDLRISVFNTWNAWRDKGKVDENTNVAETLNSWRTGNQAKEDWVNATESDAKKRPSLLGSVNSFMKEWEAKQERITFTPETIRSTLNLWKHNDDAIKSFVENSGIEANKRDELKDIIKEKRKQWEETHNLLEEGAIETFIEQELTPRLNKIITRNTWVASHRDIANMSNFDKKVEDYWKKISDNIAITDIDGALNKWMAAMRWADANQERAKSADIVGFSIKVENQLKSWTQNGININENKINETLDKWLVSYIEKQDWIMENEHKERNKLSDTIDNLWGTIEKASQKVITEDINAKLDLWDKKRKERKQWVIEHEPNPSNYENLEEQVEDFWESLSYPEFTNLNTDVKSLLDEHFTNIPVIDNRP